MYIYILYIWDISLNFLATSNILSQKIHPWKCPGSLNVRDKEKCYFIKIEETFFSRLFSCYLLEEVDAIHPCMYVCYDIRSLLVMLLSHPERMCEDMII